MKKNNIKNKKIYDKASKDLLDIFQVDIVSFFSDTAPEKITPIDTELSIPDRRVDSAFKIDNSYILNLEFQTKYKKGIEFRMLLYNTLLQSKYNLPVRTIVIYLTRLQEKSIKDFYEFTCFETNLSFKFKVIKIWELDKETILKTDNFALFPFVAVSEKNPELAKIVYTKILEAELQTDKRERLLASLSALLNLLYEKEDIKNMLSRVPKFDIVEEWKKEARKEGLAEGKSVGIEEGKSIGIEEGKSIGIEEGKSIGIEEGKIKGELNGLLNAKRDFVIRLLTKKFGNLTKKLEKSILECVDIAKLDKVADIIFDVTSLKEIEAIFK